MPIGNYIAEFASRERKLIIEIDGGQHNKELQRDYDTKRTEFLEGLGYKVIRVWNNDIFINLEGVVEFIQQNVVVPSP